MSKITLGSVGSILDAATAAAIINNNSNTIQTAMDNTLSRDGTSPNTMAANFDMNSNQILNLPAPMTQQSPLRLMDLNSFTNSGTITLLPVGGTTGQVLAKTSNVDYAVGWISTISLSNDNTFTGINTFNNTVNLNGTVNAASTFNATNAINLSGTVNITGSNDVTMTQNKNSGTEINIVNNTNGTGAYAQFGAQTSTVNQWALFGYAAAAFTLFTLDANRAYIHAGTATSGIIFHNESATNPTVFAFNNVEKARMLNGFSVGSTTDPGTGGIFSTKLSVGSSVAGSNTQAIITGNATTWNNALAGVNIGLQVVGANGTAPGIVLDSLGNNSFFAFRRADGTAAAPTQVLANEAIMGFFGYGWTNSAAFNIISGIEFVASENQTATAAGGRVDFFTTPLTTTSLTNSVRIHASGGLTVGSGIISTDPGAGAISLIGPLAFSNDTFLSRRSAAIMTMGSAEGAASPIAQSFGAQGVLSGTSNTAGALFQIFGSRSTGTGVGGDISFITTPAGGSGSSNNAFVQAMRILGSGPVIAGAQTTVLTSNIFTAAGSTSAPIAIVGANIPIIHALGSSTQKASIILDNFGNATTTGPWIVTRSGRGTPGSITATQNTDQLGFFGMVGASGANTFVDSGGAAGGVYFGARATENWSGTNQGAKLQLFATANGTNVVTNAMTIQAGVVVGAAGATDPGDGAILAIASILSKGATQGIGYATGAGSTVTQITSRTTGVTINNVSGAITLVSAAGSTTPASFTVTNSTVAATDVVHVTQKSGTDKYEIFVTNTAAGSFQITSFTTGGTTTEQPVFNFIVFKAVTA